MILDQVAASGIELEGNGDVPRATRHPGRIEAPYLQLVMERLWDEERARGSRLLRARTLDELGGASSIVESHFERAIDELPPDGRDVAAAAFAHLVTPSGMKIAHTTDDLADYANVGETTMLTVLESLTRQRILRAEQSEGSGSARFEIFHDVLARPVLNWRRMYGQERRLEAVRAAARRRHRRLLVVAGVSLIGLAIAVSLAIYALSQRSEARSQADLAQANAAQAVENASRAADASREADRQAQSAAEQAKLARARALAAVALNQLSIDPDLSLLFSTEAARLAPSSGIADVVRQSFLASRVRLVLNSNGPVTVADYSSDGTLIITASEDGRARIFDAESGELLQTLKHDDSVADAAFSPDGTVVATASTDGTGGIWRVTDGERLAIAPTRLARTLRLPSAPTGRWLRPRVAPLCGSGMRPRGI